MSKLPLCQTFQKAAEGLQFIKIIRPKSNVPDTLSDWYDVKCFAQTMLYQVTVFFVWALKAEMVTLRGVS